MVSENGGRYNQKNTKCADGLMRGLNCADRSGITLVSAYCKVLLEEKKIKNFPFPRFLDL